ncbi:Phosphatidate phosphatase LPIN3 [Halotydeus destructor]|nr:Phosphatidate phosphatase LPIN3 [Halotydeus destructor]
MNVFGTFGRIFTNVRTFYNEINSATLTGAIDVIVVEQEDGSFSCSPFHVRFGKMGVLRSREKIVDIEVNGEPVEIHMKLGDTGEAFFVEEAEEDEEVFPAHLATSPIPDDMTGFDLAKAIEEKISIVAEPCETLPPDFHPYSDGEMSPCGSPPQLAHQPPRPVSPLSDSEYEMTPKSEHELVASKSTDQATWQWGEMPQIPSRKTSSNQIAKANGGRTIDSEMPPFPVDVMSDSDSPGVLSDEAPNEDLVNEKENRSLSSNNYVNEIRTETMIKSSVIEQNLLNEKLDSPETKDESYQSGSEEDFLINKIPSEPLPIVRDLSPTSHERLMNLTNGQVPLNLKRKRRKHKKVLRLSSDQISSLNLQEGANEASFSVTTAYQGTTRCQCHIYLWRHDDKIVISDIDGTITRSDVLGQVLPYLGRDWAQCGVTNLYTKIYDNSYKFIYLSARAIGQAGPTRGYLKSVRQDDLCLPDGPLLLSPTSLISAFHREVIEKKPEEFKIACLKDIQTLFPTNPFYAGFGNKINDTWAYRAVGIHSSRIFTINHRGELKLELIQTFQSSYTRLSDVVDQMFPPLGCKKQSEIVPEFTAFNYWKQPIEDVNLDDELISSIISAKTGKTAIAKKTQSPKA